MSQTVIDLPDTDATDETGATFASLDYSPPSEAEAEAEAETKALAAGPAPAPATGLSAEQLERILASNNASLGSQQERLIAALNALQQQAPAAAAPIEPAFDLSKFLSEDASLALGEAGVVSLQSAFSAVVDSQKATIAALQARLNTMHGQMQSKFVDDFRRGGGDILDTPEGKSFMAEIDPATGIQRSEGVERLGRSYLDMMVKQAVHKFRRPAIATGGGVAPTVAPTAASASAGALKKIDSELAALRSKPMGSLTPADKARVSELSVHKARLMMKT